MITAYLTPKKWEAGASVTISGLPTAGENLVIDYSPHASANAGSPDATSAQIVRVSPNILEIRVEDRLVRLAPLNPGETVAQREAGKKLMVGWIVQP